MILFFPFLCSRLQHHITPLFKFYISGENIQHYFESMYAYVLNKCHVPFCTLSFLSNSMIEKTFHINIFDFLNCDRIIYILRLLSKPQIYGHLVSDFSSYLPSQIMIQQTFCIYPIAQEFLSS